MKSLTLEQLKSLDREGWLCFQLPDLWLRLRDQAQILCQQDQLKFSEIKTSHPNHDSQLIRNDLVCWLSSDTVVASEKKFSQYINLWMSEIKNYFRIGLDHFEAHYALYPADHFYLRHSDQKKEQNQRQFSFVYYLNASWKNTQGGELVGYHGSSKLQKFNVKPQGGSLVIFKSDIEHEVLASHADRFSISGWMRTP